MNLAARMTLDNRGFTGPLGQSQRGLGSFLGGVRKLIGPLALVTAGIVGVTAAVAGLKGAVGEGANLEKLEISFETMLGSAQVARDTLEGVIDFAATTPFEIPELASAAKQMIAFGIGSQQVVPTLRTLGDVASALDINLGELADVYGRNLVQGRLFARDIYQFQGRGIPIITELAKQFGVAESEVMALVTAGKVGSNELVTAFQNMTGEGGRFNNMTERLSQTFTGQMSNLKDAIGSRLRDFGRPLVDGLKPFVTQAVEMLDGLDDEAASLGLKLKNVLAIGGAALSEGRFGELLGAGIELGAAKGGNALIGMMQTGIDILGLGVAHVFSPEFFNGLATGFLGVMSKLDAALLEIFQKPIVMLQAGIEKAVQEVVQMMSEIPGLRNIMGVGAGFEAESFSSIAERMATDAQRNGASLFGMNSNDLKAQGDRLMAESGRALAAAFAGFEDHVKSIIDDFESSDLFDAAGARQGLKVIVESMRTTIAALSGQAQEVATASQGLGGTVASGLRGGGLRPDVDSLARIGGFIGGTGPAADHARRTADNTARTVSLLQQIKTDMGNSTALSSAWA